ncbi:MAG: hypothetical protein HPY74_04375 [Firmicutes bacterium]|nr:hypothetical protein [Bacillota bacterium]
MASIYLWAVFRPFLGLVESIKKTAAGMAYPCRGEPWGRKRCRLKRGGRRRPPLESHQPAMRAERL